MRVIHFTNRHEACASVRNDYLKSQRKKYFPAHQIQDVQAHKMEAQKEGAIIIDRLKKCCFYSKFMDKESQIRVLSELSFSFKIVTSPFSTFNVEWNKGELKDTGFFSEITL